MKATLFTNKNFHTLTFRNLSLEQVASRRRCAVLVNWQWLTCSSCSSSKTLSNMALSTFHTWEMHRHKQSCSGEENGRKNLDVSRSPWPSCHWSRSQADGHLGSRYSRAPRHHGPGSPSASHPWCFWTPDSRGTITGTTIVHHLLHKTVIVLARKASSFPICFSWDELCFSTLSVLLAPADAILVPSWEKQAE